MQPEGRTQPFYLKNHWGGGKVTLGFWPDRIRTLVSMVTDSFHRFTNGENLVATLASLFLKVSFSFLQVTRTTITSHMSSNLGLVRSWTTELAALEGLEKSH